MSLRTPSRRARRIAVAVATPALLALTGWMLVARVDPASAVAALGRADARLSALAGLGLLLGTVASAFIWRLSVRAAGLEVGLGHLVGAHFAGLAASTALPGQVGEATRFALARRHPAARRANARLAGSMAAHRLFEGLVAFAVAFAAVAAGAVPNLGTTPRALAGVALVGTLGTMGLAVALGPDRARRLPRRLRGAVQSFLAGTALFRRPGDMGRAGALALASVGLRIGALALLLLAFGAPPTAALVAFCCVLLAGLVPILPGGLGVREAALVPALAAGFGVAPSTALALSLAVQALMAAQALTGGVPLGLWTARRRPALAAA